MKHLIALVLSVLLAVSVSVPLSFAAQPKGCDGPPDLCAQIIDLNKKLSESKAAAAKTTEKKVAEVRAAEEQSKEEQMAKTIAGAASLAVALKILLSLLDKWKGYFKGSKGKAWLKVVTLVVGILAFVATNVGLGVPFWQSLILAGGGPGAILVHELARIIPVLRGQKTDIPPDLMSEPPPASRA